MKKTLSFILLSAVASLLCHATEPSPAALLRDSMPETWILETRYSQTTPTEDSWWTSFHDPVLERLVSTAVSNNFDVRAAQRRIEVAAQVSRATKAGYYPTLGISAGWDDYNTATTVHGSHAHETNTDYFQLGLTMTWEIDVFGRIRAQSKADKASYEASIADYDATLVSLCSNVAKAYFQLRLSQAEIAVAESNIANAEYQEKLAKARYEVGLRPAIDVLQAGMSVAQTKATLPPLRADVSSAINRIALLLAVYPDKLEYLREYAPLPVTPEPGIQASPQSLLCRRPDIVAAEKQLAATAAQIGIAKKDFLPTLSLTASAGTQSGKLTELFGKDSYYYRITPTLSWTIFDGMARNARLAEARLQMEAQIESYNLSVMTAVSEVNDAMISWQSLTEQLEYRRQLQRDAERQLKLEIDRYTQGLIEFSDVANAQTTLLQAENTLVQTQAARLAALVTLYTALGGGYQTVTNNESL